MFGLMLKFVLGECFIINGIMLENGDCLGCICVLGFDVMVFCCCDVLKLIEVDMLVKQVYYVIQLLIMKDFEEEDIFFVFYCVCEDFKDVFGYIKFDLILILCEMLCCGNYYFVLCYFKQVIEFEVQLFGQEDFGVLVV